MYVAALRQRRTHQARIFLIVPGANLNYFGASAGGAAAAGAGAGAGVPTAGGAEAAAWGCAFGLIQQAWTHPFRLDGTLGSINPPNRVRQRNAAWTWPPGQPNRSYRSRWRKAVS